MRRLTIAFFRDLRYGARLLRRSAVFSAIAVLSLAQTVRETLARAEPRLPIIEVVPLESRLARGVIQDRMIAR